MDGHLGEVCEPQRTAGLETDVRSRGEASNGEDGDDECGELDEGAAHEPGGMDAAGASSELDRGGEDLAEAARGFAVGSARARDGGV